MRVTTRVYKLHVVLKTMEDENRCPICFDVVDGTAHELGCGHRFHVDCILSWAQSDSEMHDSCPVCRFTENDEHNRSFEQMRLFTHRGSADLGHYRRCESALERVSTQLTEGEQQLMEFLRTEVERAERANQAAVVNFRQFKQEHKETITRQRQLERRGWQTKFRLQRARQNLLAVFPVTRVIVPTTRRRRAVPMVLRRSERIANGASA